MRVEMSLQIAWITGAGSGLGRAMALRLVAEGWTVAATARTQEDLAGLAAEPAAQGRIFSFAGDVTDRAGLIDIAARIEREIGPITVAFLSAGIYLPFGLDDFSAEKIARLLDVNVIGVANAIEAVLPGFRARNAGKIVVVSSLTQYRGMMRTAGYGASKAALLAMCETLRLQTRKTGIAVQIVVAGYIQTRMTAKAPFPLPGIITAEDAAEQVLAGMKRDAFEILVPRKVVATVRRARLMPSRLYFWYAARTPLFGGTRGG
jgi:NAD(P)-dependent dehydrogenase (short-subunit alcohol dehydrogenase family)